MTSTRVKILPSTQLCKLNMRRVLKTTSLLTILNVHGNIYGREDMRKNGLTFPREQSGPSVLQFQAVSWVSE